MIKEVIVVEGKQDIAAVSRAVDAECIATGGFALGPRILERLTQAYQKRGLIILTDPDSAGERIRKYVSARFPLAKHAFIPRKDAMAHGDIGVEQASTEAIRLAIGKVRYVQYQPVQEFSWEDMLKSNLSGTPDASRRRSCMGEKTGNRVC